MRRWGFPHDGTDYIIFQQKCPLIPPLFSAEKQEIPSGAGREAFFCREKGMEMSENPGIKHAEAQCQLNLLTLTRRRRISLAAQIPQIPEGIYFAEKKQPLSGRQRLFLFCQRVTKGRRNEVKVSKSSVANLFDKLAFT